MNTIIKSTNTMTINDISMPIFTGTIRLDWVRTAEAKGYDFVARILDRLHFALRCRRCGTLNKVARFTLMTAQPLCHACIEHAWASDAKAVGLKFLRRDETNRHYGIYGLPCDHETRRQFEFIKRVGAGETGLRCETCLGEKDASEAKAQGWELIGPDPKGDPNYRKYRHKACGHEQRVARVNMQTSRFGCGGCGKEWPATPSYLYAMTFTLASGREVIKLGFSKNPESRLSYQLKLDPAMPCSILQKVAVPTGQDAIRLEKQLHTKLHQAHSDCVVNPASYRDQIRVKSEIYDARLAKTILTHLALVEADVKHPAI